MQKCDLSRNTVRLVRFVLKVSMQNDRDFLSVISLCGKKIPPFRPVFLCRNNKLVHLFLVVLSYMTQGRSVILEKLLVAQILRKSHAFFLAQGKFVAVIITFRHLSQFFHLLTYLLTYSLHGVESFLRS